MIDYQEIGNNIKICRIRCNLKQAELAEMVGVTSQHISHVERCQTKPSLTLLVDISTALRVDLNTPPETVPLDRTNGAARPLKWCMVTADMVH